MFPGSGVFIQVDFVDFTNFVQLTIDGEMDQDSDRLVRDPLLATMASPVGATVSAVRRWVCFTRRPLQMCVAAVLPNSRSSLLQPQFCCETNINKQCHTFHFS